MKTIRECDADMTGGTKKCCDNCKWYYWYYDLCTKWQSHVDSRSVYMCFEKNEYADVIAQISCRKNAGFRNG